MQKIKVKGLSVNKIVETDRQADGADWFTSLTNAVGDKKSLGEREAPPSVIAAVRSQIYNMV